MTDYIVQVTEIKHKSIEVKADSEHDALEMVRKSMRTGKIDMSRASSQDEYEVTEA